MHACMRKYHVICACMYEEVICACMYEEVSCDELYDVCVFITCRSPHHVIIGPPCVHSNCAG